MKPNRVESFRRQSAPLAGFLYQPGEGGGRAALNFGDTYTVKIIEGWTTAGRWCTCDEGDVSVDEDSVVRIPVKAAFLLIHLVVFGHVNA